MKDALGAVQRVLVLGGTSEIGVAIVDELATNGRLVEIVLACRRPEAASATVERLGAAGIEARAIAFDARRPETHVAVVADAATNGDLDVVIVAAGILGDKDAPLVDPTAAAELFEVNLAGCAAAMVAAAGRLRDQGHGQLVVLSSVAGVRVRASNAVYGATKAGLDGLAQGMADALAADGVDVVIVRPGFVHTKMTEGMEPAPFSTDAATVARLTVAGMRAGRRVVWAPGILRWVFGVFRLLPAPLWRAVAARG